MRDNLDPPRDWDRSGLPGWCYFSEELLELEKRELFRTHWQIVCHIGDIPSAGDFMTFDIAGERALVLRGRDGHVRAFHNLCRHRGSRVVAPERGTCKAAVICPYHGWAYNLDGTLRGAAQPGTFPDLDPVEWGLKPLEMEIWHGFVFVRFAPSEQPPVARILDRFESEVAPYGAEAIVPAQSRSWGDEVAVNWKAVRDVDNEGYHVPMAHPGLNELYGRGYTDEPFIGGASRSFGAFNPPPARLWSVDRYLKILPEADWLPPSHRRAWLYIGLFPNSVIAFYPDSILFYQDVPVAAHRTVVRSRVYRHADESRAMRAARYLSGRIDGDTAAEDRMLSIWACEATRSSGYDGIILSDLEYGIRTHHDHLRAVIPAYNLDAEPEPGTLAAVNERLKSQASRGREREMSDATSAQSAGTPS